MFPGAEPRKESSKGGRGKFLRRKMTRMGPLVNGESYAEGGLQVSCLEDGEELPAEGGGGAGQRKQKKRGSTHLVRVSPPMTNKDPSEKRIAASEGSEKGVEGGELKKRKIIRALVTPSYNQRQSPRRKKKLHYGRGTEGIHTREERENFRGERGRY